MEEGSYKYQLQLVVEFKTVNVKSISYFVMDLYMFSFLSYPLII